MSRRYASFQPPDDLADDTLRAMLHGRRDYQERPMPGCHERCCCGRRDTYADWLQERLLWQIGGFDLVPILTMVLAFLLAVLIGARIGGGSW